MNPRASLLARLAVYAAALFVLATVRLPDSATQSSLPSLRSAQPASPIDPVRLLLAGILISGIAVEVLRRRPVC